MPVSIRGTAGGSVTLSSGAAATDTTLTLPNTTGTVALTASPTFSGTVTATTVTSPASTALTIQSAGTTAMTVNTSQNVGIGGAASSDTTYKWLTLTGPTTSGGGILQVQNSDASVSANFFCNNLAGYIGTGSSHPLLFRINSSEVARFDTSGNLLVGTTSSLASAKISVKSSTNVIISQCDNGLSNILTTNTSGTSSYNGAVFCNNGTSFSTCGTISVSGSSVAYNTSSDYRLKENVAPMNNGLATIRALNPVTYDWVSDKTAGEGFIAHELQSVIPQAVIGEKDAINEDGSIKPQGVDYSKIVVHLVAACQELSAKNDALEARLAALEAK